MKDNVGKENYRPVSQSLKRVMLQKTFKRTMYHRMNYFMIDKLSKELTSFTKNHSTTLLELHVINTEKNY